jgi:hypothetical protein
VQESSDVTWKEAEVITEDDDSVVHVRSSRMWCRREKENDNNECHPHDCRHSDWQALRKTGKHITTYHKQSESTDKFSKRKWPRFKPSAT